MLNTAAVLSAGTGVCLRSDLSRVQVGRSAGTDQHRSTASRSETLHVEERAGQSATDQCGPIPARRSLVRSRRGGGTRKFAQSSAGLSCGCQSKRLPEIARWGCRARQTRRKSGHEKRWPDPRHLGVCARLAHLCAHGTLRRASKSARMRNSPNSAQACKWETRGRAGASLLERGLERPVVGAFGRNPLRGRGKEPGLHDFTQADVPE